MQINGPDAAEQERRCLKQENVRLAGALSRAVEALLELHGPLDDPALGWRGDHPSSPNLYQCEFCGKEHEDLRFIEHTPVCRVLAVRAVLADNAS